MRRVDSGQCLGCTVGSVSTTTAANGHTDGPQPNADPTTHPTTDQGQPKPAKVQLLVERSTRNEVTDLGRQLGRNQDEIVAAGVALLRKRIGEERRKAKNDWVAEVTGSQS